MRWVVVLAVVVGGLLALGWWLRTRLVIVTVRGESMAPAYRPGDRVLVRRVTLPRIRHRDVIVATGGRPRPTTLVPPGETDPAWMLKRVYALPGDPVPRDLMPALREAPERQVPDGRFLVLGDNAEASADSRQSGWFYAANLLGVVVAHLPTAQAR
jgi:signal peptidase I